jgi:hypothetical protein
LGILLPPSPLSLPPPAPPRAPRAPPTTGTRAQTEHDFELLGQMKIQHNHLSTDIHRDYTLILAEFDGLFFKNNSQLEPNIVLFCDVALSPLWSPSPPPPPPSLSLSFSLTEPMLVVRSREYSLRRASTNPRLTVFFLLLSPVLHPPMPLSTHTHTPTTTTPNPDTEGKGLGHTHPNGAFSRRRAFVKHPAWGKSVDTAQKVRACERSRPGVCGGM